MATGSCQRELWSEKILSFLRIDIFMSQYLSKPSEKFDLFFIFWKFSSITMYHVTLRPRFERKSLPFLPSFLFPSFPPSLLCFPSLLILGNSKAYFKSSGIYLNSKKVTSCSKSGINGLLMHAKSHIIICALICCFFFFFFNFIF